VAINRTVLCEATGKKKAAAVDCINKLIHESWLIEMPIPQNVRKNPKQDSYIIGLTPQERDAYKKDRALPAGADNPPAAFTKPKVVSTPSVPDPEVDTSDKGKTAGFEPPSGAGE
jgi:hypothetical protein